LWIIGVCPPRSSFARQPSVARSNRRASPGARHVLPSLHRAGCDDSEDNRRPLAF
jgi:hypothetical protein